MLVAGILGTLLPHAGISNTSQQHLNVLLLIPIIIWGNMQDLPTDTQALESTIDDYSEEYGDQKTIETLTQWLNRTQGKSYIIIKTETVNNLIADGKRSGKLDQLENLRQNLSNANLDDFNKANMYDYIMKEMVKL